jgi:hypothetical protein
MAPAQVLRAASNPTSANPSMAITEPPTWP